MKSIQLGKSGLMVSEIGFGGIPIIPLSHEAGVDVVRHCHARGITFFDTANMYGNSEKMIGDALATVRKNVVIATKTTRRDKAGAAEHIALSLRNLKTDVIDLYQFHAVSKDEDLETILAPEGAMQAAREAVAAGKIRHVGLSSHKIEVALKACRTGQFETLQFPFNFIENEPAGELFKTARGQNMGIIGMKPLGGGLLQKAALCFKFLQQYPDVVPIPGISQTAEIDEIIALYDHRQPLSDKEKAEIEAIRAELGNKFCHRCGYCQPCAQGVAITEVMMFRSSARRLSPKVAAALSRKAMATVDLCSNCGECVEKCPYELDIPVLIRELKELHAALGA
ncbi:MAG: aldo/keto reductase [Desulfobacteraceae bacterium]|nr:MAG: aldo/keto reductase [Desulfobacteraceae bacterium]